MKPDLTCHGMTPAPACDSKTNKDDSALHHLHIRVSNGEEARTRHTRERRAMRAFPPLLSTSV